MNDNPTGPDMYDEYKPEPQPWERQQPGEPLESYRWFQVYFCLPQPRTFTKRQPDPRPETRKQACLQGRRVTGAGKNAPPPPTDRQGGSFALQNEWRSLLLAEVAYRNRYITLEDTSRALAGAAIGELDRIRARRLLGPLLRHQQGLLRLIEPKKQDRELPYRRTQAGSNDFRQNDLKSRAK